MRCGHATRVGRLALPPASVATQHFFILLSKVGALVGGVFSDPWVRAVHLLAAADRSGRR
ncbi:hypothetical protein BN9982_700008 [Mycobacterium tuberculosis]|nr:hypothetical protein BN9982_700008 [Mycobacterium tuberculosis]